MIDLNSNIWSNLQHAYGTAVDIPDMLLRLDKEDSSTLDELFGSICHQGSVYTASFAAVPHLVQSAQIIKSAEFRAQVLILVGSICSSNDFRGRGEKLSAEIQYEYETSLPKALELSVVTLREDINPYTAIYLLGATASLKGYREMGRLLVGFADEEFICICSKCSSDLYVWPHGEELTVAAEDPVSSPKTDRMHVTPGPVENSINTDIYSWLYELTETEILRSIQQKLPYLFGTVICPICSHSFSLIDRLLDEQK